MRIKNNVGKIACKKISVKNNIPLVVIEEILYQYYNMIAEDIKNADYTKEETFLNYNLPKLGKIYVSLPKLKLIKSIKKID